MPAKKFKNEQVQRFPESPRLRAKVAWYKIYQDKGMFDKAEALRQKLLKLGIDPAKYRFYAPPKKSKKPHPKKIVLPRERLYDYLMDKLHETRLEGKLADFAKELEATKDKLKHRIATTSNHEERALLKEQLTAVNHTLSKAHQILILKIFKEHGMPIPEGRRIMHISDLYDKLEEADIPTWVVDELIEKGELKKERAGWLSTTQTFLKETL